MRTKPCSTGSQAVASISGCRTRQGGHTVAVSWHQHYVVAAAGSFSIIKQSMALNCFPRVTVIHKSSLVGGQIYIEGAPLILNLGD